MKKWDKVDLAWIATFAVSAGTCALLAAVAYLILLALGKIVYGPAPVESFCAIAAGIAVLLILKRKDAAAGMFASIALALGLLVLFTGCSPQQHHSHTPGLEKEARAAALTAGQVESLQIITYTLWAEARSEGEEGMRAVASVIYNRSDGNPAEFVNTCLKPHQFNCWNGADWRTTKLVPPQLAEMRAAGGPDRKATETCLRIADEMVFGTFVPTGDWTHFYNPLQSTPSWGQQMTDVKAIGKQYFGVLEPERFVRDIDADIVASMQEVECSLGRIKEIARSMQKSEVE